MEEPADAQLVVVVRPTHRHVDLFHHLLGQARLGRPRVMIGQSQLVKVVVDSEHEVVAAVPLGSSADGTEVPSRRPSVGLRRLPSAEDHLSSGLSWLLSAQALLPSVGLHRLLSTLTLLAPGLRRLLLGSGAVRARVFRLLSARTLPFATGLSRLLLGSPRLLSTSVDIPDRGGQPHRTSIVRGKCRENSKV